MNDPEGGPEAAEAVPGPPEDCPYCRWPVLCTEHAEELRPW